MNSKILRVLFALVALFCVSPLMSQTLVIYHPDGTSTNVSLQATFSIAPTDDKYVIESGSTHFEIEKDRVSSMSYQSVKGDVNSDGEVTIADAVSVVNIVLNRDPEEADKGLVVWMR